MPPVPTAPAELAAEPLPPTEPVEGAAEVVAPELAAWAAWAAGEGETSDEPVFLLIEPNGMLGLTFGEPS